MFKIFVVLVSVAGAPVGEMSSNKSFDTKEACEAVRSEMIERLKVELAENNPDVVVESSRCDVAPKED